MVRPCHWRSIYIWQCAILPMFFLSHGMYGQDVNRMDGLPCAEVAQKIIADSASIWSHSNESDIDYFCLGEYFALRDSAQGALVIQTYGEPLNQDPCVICKHEENGIQFIYHFSIITAEVSSFIAGYNATSTRIIRELLGHKKYEWINEPDSIALTATKIMDQINLDNDRYFSGVLANDSTLNVKLSLEALPCLKGIDLNLLSFEVFGRGAKESYVIGYEVFKNSGILVPLRATRRAWVTMRVLLDKIPGACACPALKNHMIWQLPVTVSR